MFFTGELFDSFLLQDFALWRKVNPNGRTFSIRLSLNLLHGIVQWLAHHHHSGSTAVGAMINLTVFVVGPIANVVDMYLDMSAILCSFDDACCECRFKHLWKEGKDVNSHRWTYVISRVSFRESDRYQLV